ncbi:MAG: ABC transporter ATP-binding protein, partial [Acidobacteria bacterium]|nr:ABC transporter ATP-binding protein [Acidobacteriota bacterium]
LEQQLGLAQALPSTPDKPLAPSNGENKSKRLNPIKRKQMEDRAQKLEKEISRLEAAVAQCESSLEQFTSAEASARFTQELEDNRKQLEQCIGEWEDLGRQLET